MVIPAKAQTEPNPKPIYNKIKEHSRVHRVLCFANFYIHFFVFFKNMLRIISNTELNKNNY